MIPALDINSSNRVTELNTVVYGSGQKIMVAFHGIGQDHHCFMPLVEVLKEEYTFYLFDLPFHGQSPPLPTEKLTMAAWQSFLEVFLVENNVQEFSVTGFSMGGKFALATLQLFPTRIKSCWLFAPDGITESPWYKIATRFWLGKNLFWFFTNNIAYFKRLATILVKIGLVNKSAAKFIETTLSTSAQRKRVYRSWIGFSLIRADISLITQIAKKNKVDLKLFLGQYDALLPAHYVRPLLSQLIELKPIILKTGHHRLIEKAAEWLKDVPSSN